MNLCSFSEKILESEGQAIHYIFSSAGCRKGCRSYPLRKKEHFVKA